MSVLTALALALAAGGAAMQYQGQRKAAKAQEEALAEQRKAEELRRRQMELEAQRKKRDIVRTALASRSRALSTSIAQGAGVGGSGLQGAYGDIAGQTGANLVATNQNLDIGRGIFDANLATSYAYSRAASAQSTVALGQGLSSLGGALIRNQEAIGRIGTYFTKRRGGGYGGSSSDMEWGGAY